MLQGYLCVHEAVQIRRDHQPRKALTYGDELFARLFVRWSWSPMLIQLLEYQCEVERARMSRGCVREASSF